jgi:hypothetical protein
MPQTQNINAGLKPKPFWTRPNGASDFESGLVESEPSDFASGLVDTPPPQPTTLQRAGAALTAPVFDLSRPLAQTGAAIGQALTAAPAAELTVGEKLIPRLPVSLQPGARTVDIAARGLLGGIRAFPETAMADVGRMLSPSPLTYMTAGGFNAGPALQKLVAGGFTVTNAVGAIRSYSKAAEETPRLEGESNLDFAERLATRPEMQNAATQAAFTLIGLSGVLARPVPRDTTRIEAALTRGIKPIASKTNWPQEVRTALPDLAEEARAAEAAGKPINTVDAALDATVNAEKKLWGEYDALLGPQAKKVVDTSPIADAIDATVTKRFAEQHPSEATSIRNVARTYRTQMTLADLEARLQAANNDLYGFYAKNRVGQRVAESDPAMGHVVAEAQGIRSLLYDTLGQATGRDAGVLKLRYGALKSIEEELLRRRNVSARLAADSLSEQLSFSRGIARVAKGLLTGSPVGAAEGAAQMAMARYLKEKNTSDALIGAAFKDLLRQAGPQRVYYRGTPPAPSPPPAGGRSFPGGAPEAAPGALAPTGRPSETFSIPGLSPEEVIEFNRRMQARKDLSAGPSSFTPPGTPGANF